MEFVQNFTPPDFQAKNFTLSISPNFNSFSKKKTQKMSEIGEIYAAGKNFTLLPALTAWTNSTIAWWSELPSVMACDTFSHRPLLSQHAPLSAKIIILEIVIKRLFFEIWKIVTFGIMIRKLSTFY